MKGYIAIMQKVCHPVLAFIIYFKTISFRMPKIIFSLSCFNLLYEESTVIIIVQAVVVSLLNNGNCMYTSILIS